MGANHSTHGSNEQPNAVRELLVAVSYPGLAVGFVGGVLAVPIGAALALVSLFVLNAFARVNAAIATALLGPS